MPRYVIHILTDNAQEVCTCKQDPAAAIYRNGFRHKARAQTEARRTNGRLGCPRHYAAVFHLTDTGPGSHYE